MIRIDPRAWIALTVSLFLLPLAARASDWSHWRGPWQTGVSPETDLPTAWDADTNLIWKAPYGCRSTPLVMNGQVYVINYTAKKFKEADGRIKDRPESIQEQVMCLDADTGKVRWQYKFNVWLSDIVTSRLGWTNLAGDPKTGNVYAHGTQGLLLCLDKNGKLLWSRSLTEEFGRVTGYGGRVTSPIVDEDLVIIGMINSAWGNLAKGAYRYVAFNKNTGEVVWWGEPGGPMRGTYYSVPVVATINGERLLISGGGNGSLDALKIRTGEHVWGYPVSVGAVNSAPVVEGTRVFIGHGEENLDNNVQGRVLCVDAGEVKDDKPRLVWQVDGIKARYASPIVHEGRLYVPDDIARLHCLDAKTGKPLWKRPFSYGRESRGSPVLADGKIYVGEVNSVFHILKPGPKSCTRLHKHFFPSTDGVSDVEINGSPAVANGRVYFSTNEEILCIGKKGAKPAPPVETDAALAKSDGTITHLQLIPADVEVHPGETVTFKVRGFDTHGNFVQEVMVDGWGFLTPPLPPGAKQGPPALAGAWSPDGKLTVDARKASQAGYVAAKFGDVTGKARVRVVPSLPYVQDFSKIPDGAVPAGWVNAQGKFRVQTLKGEKVLAKVNNSARPPIARGNAFIGLPSQSNYTIECDVMGGKAGTDMPEMGIVANRYTLHLVGNIQALKITSWEALPRVDRTVQFPWQAGTWYRLKLTVALEEGQAIVKGKCWPRDKAEPSAWTVEVADAYPNREGAPALYGYVQGNQGDVLGTEIYYDNVRISANPK